MKRTRLITFIRQFGQLPVAARLHGIRHIAFILPQTVDVRCLRYNTLHYNTYAIVD